MAEKKRGRPVKLTDEITEKIASYLSHGLTRKRACIGAQISYQTFLNWLERGHKEFTRLENGTPAKVAKVKAKDEEIYLIFYNQIQEAETTAVYNWQIQVNEGAKFNPSFALKMLQLRDPDGYRPSPEETVTYDLAALLAAGKIDRTHLERIARGEKPSTVLADAGSSSITPI